MNETGIQCERDQLPLYTKKNGRENARMRAKHNQRSSLRDGQV